MLSCTMKLVIALLLFAFAQPHVSASDCASVPHDDIYLLPNCSLRTALGKIDKCVFRHLPVRINGVSYDECSAGWSDLYDCALSVLDECDGSSICPSILSGIPFPGGVSLRTFLGGLKNTALGFITPYACLDLSLFQYRPIRMALRHYLNGALDVNVNYTEPICNNNFVPTLLDWAEHLFPRLPEFINNPRALCEVVDSFGPMLYNLTVNNCDWQNLTQLFPGNTTTLVGPITVELLSKMIEISIEHINAAEVPQCRECTNTTLCSYGTCRVNGYGNEYCECFFGYTGDSCEVPKCPDVLEGDMPLFEFCSLHEFLAMGSECINRNYPFLTSENTTECRGNVMAAANCLSELHSRCTNGSAGCPGAFPDPSGDLLGKFIQNEVVNFTSPLMENAFTLLCELPYYNGSLVRPPKTFDIGFPVCPNNTIDTLVDTWVLGANWYFARPDLGCQVLDFYKYRIWNITSQCQWNRISDVLPSALQENATYFANLLRNSHGFFLQWVYPPCRGCERLQCQGGGTCLTSFGIEYCECTPYRSGIECEYVDPCYEYYCQNGGYCTSYNGNATCHCPEYTSGEKCEILINAPCRYLSCYNGGSCMRNGSHEFCACQSGYTGYNCQTPVVTNATCRPVTEFSSQREFIEAWMCEYGRYKKNICEWKEGVESWWRSCSNFETAEFGDWLPWEEGRRQIWQRHDWSPTRGWNGFSQIWNSAFVCTQTHNVQCSGGPRSCYYDCNGCYTCYCPTGCYSNWRSLFNVWVAERRNHERRTAIYSSLIEQCTRNTEAECPFQTSTSSPVTGSPPLTGSSTWSPPTVHPSPTFTIPSSTGSPPTFTIPTSTSTGFSTTVRPSPPTHSPNGTTASTGSPP